jgi:glycosyltransferase involved in cell wall biosynthesis
MKVLIALASSSYQLSGVTRHAINLGRCLLTRSEIAEVHLVAAPWQQDFVRDASPHGDKRLHLHSAPIGNSAVSRNLWFYSHLPKLATQLGADIVHLAYPAPVRRSAFHCPVVVTLHDLYPYDIPENFGFPKVLFNRAVLRRCLESVDAIACVSQSTFSGLKAIDPELAQKKALVIYNSVEQPADPSAESAPPEWRYSPFLLCVAQHRRNKNIRLALCVFERLLRTRQIAPDTRMLILGIPGPETPAIQGFIATSGLAQSVLLLNGISDQQLQWCYRNCSLLLAPSFIEGFGLPVAEALLAGCRIVCSDIPAFRELCGNTCRFVPLGPQQVTAFADAAVDVLGHPPPDPILLPQLSAHAVAESYMQLYRSLTPPAGSHVSSHLAPAHSTGERQHLI